MSLSIRAWSVGRVLGLPKPAITYQRGQGQTGIRGRAVQQHGAGAAFSHFAALLGPGEAQLIPEHGQQGLARLHLHLHGLPVDGAGNVHFFAHA